MTAVFHRLKKQGRFEMVGDGKVYEVRDCQNGAVVHRTDSRFSAYGALGRANKTEKKSARTRKRKCMCCGNEFLSEGIHNRLCKYCRQSVGRLGNEMGA